jgi:lysophospholipase L1-like esterase
VNAWVRTQTIADGVVDFDAAVRDVADPSRLDARYDSGDHLHPSLAGYQAMGEAVDLALLRGRRCRSRKTSPY